MSNGSATQAKSTLVAANPEFPVRRVFGECECTTRWSGCRARAPREVPMVECHIMGRVNYDEWFERNPEICAGQPVIRGTRIPLRTILSSLAEGATFDEILQDFPTLTSEQVRAVVAFAASSAEEDLPVPGLLPV